MQLSLTHGNLKFLLSCVAWWAWAFAYFEATDKSICFGPRAMMVLGYKILALSEISKFYWKQLCPCLGTGGINQM